MRHPVISPKGFRPSALHYPKSMTINLPQIFAAYGQKQNYVRTRCTIAAFKELSDILSFLSRYVILPGGVMRSTLKRSGGQVLQFPQMEIDVRKFCLLVDT